MDADNSPSTRLDRIWARPIIGLPVGAAKNPEYALLSGQIEDEQGKYNLLNLAPNARIDPQEVLVLERLLGWLGVDSSLALVMAHRVADAQFVHAPGPRGGGLAGIAELSVLN